MKKILVFAALIPAFLACDPGPPPPPGPADPVVTDKPTPADADGALYSIRYVTIYEEDDDTLYGDFYYGWFGNHIDSEVAGTLTCNGYEMIITQPGTNFKAPWYVGTGMDYALEYDKWKLTGTSSYGSWEFTDSLRHPGFSGLTMPKVYEMGNPLRLKFTSDLCEGVIIEVGDGFGNVARKTVTSGTQTVIFSFSEIKHVVTGAGEIYIDLNAVKLSPRTLGGKKIYTVKQGIWQYFAKVQ